MWKKPWTMKEGFAISVAIAFVGVILQLATGSIVWDAFVWPVILPKEFPDALTISEQKELQMTLNSTCQVTMLRFSNGESWG